MGILPSVVPTEIRTSKVTQEPQLQNSTFRAYVFWLSMLHIGLLVYLLVVYTGPGVMLASCEILLWAGPLFGLAAAVFDNSCSDRRRRSNSASRAVWVVPVGTESAWAAIYADAMLRMPWLPMAAAFVSCIPRVCTDVTVLREALNVCTANPGYQPPSEPPSSKFAVVLVDTTTLVFVVCVLVILQRRTIQSVTPFPSNPIFYSGVSVCVVAAEWISVGTRDADGYSPWITWGAQTTAGAGWAVLAVCYTIVVVRIGILLWAHGNSSSPTLSPSSLMTPHELHVHPQLAQLGNRLVFSPQPEKVVSHTRVRGKANTTTPSIPVETRDQSSTGVEPVNFMVVSSPDNSNLSSLPGNRDSVVNSSALSSAFSSMSASIPSGVSAQEQKQEKKQEQKQEKEYAQQTQKASNGVGSAVHKNGECSVHVNTKEQPGVSELLDVPMNERVLFAPRRQLPWSPPCLIQTAFSLPLGSGVGEARMIPHKTRSLPTQRKAEYPSRVFLVGNIFGAGSKVIPEQPSTQTAVRTVQPTYPNLSAFQPARTKLAAGGIVSGHNESSRNVNLRRNAPPRLTLVSPRAKRTTGGSCVPLWFTRRLFGCPWQISKSTEQRFRFCVIMYPFVLLPIVRCIDVANGFSAGEPGILRRGALDAILSTVLCVGVVVREKLVANSARKPSALADLRFVNRRRSSLVSVVSFANEGSFHAGSPHAANNRSLASQAAASDLTTEAHSEESTARVWGKPRVAGGMMRTSTPGDDAGVTKSNIVAMDQLGT